MAFPESANQALLGPTTQHRRARHQRPIPTIPSNRRSILGGVLANPCGYAEAFGPLLMLDTGGILVAAALGPARQDAWLAAAAQRDMGPTSTEK